MYTRQETAKHKQAFWTAFGRYLQPIPSADGEPVNWVNYKTGIPGINFRMYAEAKYAGIAIVLSQNDIALQQAYYDQFAKLQAILTGTVNEDWQWQALIQDEFGKTISTISKELPAVNVNNTEDWPAIISFLKPRIIALDEFWSMTKYSFESIGAL